MTLGTRGIAFFENRNISAETASRFEIYTARRARDGVTVTPSISGNVIAFPYIEHGVTVNEKYRELPKTFWQRKGGRKTFWNSDVLDDPHLQQLVITEGEPDALTAIECGFPHSVSVPDGAPPVSQEPDDSKPGDDRTG